MLFALGLGPDLIAVTHECDYPPAAQELPKVTRDVLPPDLSSAEIDAAVKERTLAGESIYELDTELLHDLRPDLIVTQALCSVFSYREAEMHREQLAAVGAGEVVAVDAASYFSRPGPRIVDGLELLAHILHPELVPEAPGDVLTIEL